MSAKDDLKASIKAEAEAATKGEKASDNSTKKPTDSADEPPAPPPKMPNRPVDPFVQGLSELKDAFPDTDTGVLRAVLVAAQGELEQAFNGLLALTDDTIRPRPRESDVAAQRKQIEHDERVARDLASRYYRSGNGNTRGGEGRRDDGYSARYEDRPPADANTGNPIGDIDYNEIRDNISRGWQEASKRAGSLLNTLRERINNELNSDRDVEQAIYDEPRPRRSQNLYGGRRRSDEDEPLQDPRTRQNRQGQDAPPPQPARPTRPVNAFGDETPARWEPLRTETTAAPESDAFFIGESDEEELEELDDQAQPTKAKETKTQEPKAADSKESKEEAKEAKVDESKEEDSKDAKDSKDSKDSKK